MRVLIAGGGGREHALAWRLVARPRRRPRSSARRATPASPPSRELAAVDAGDPDALLALAERESIDLTVIGPELPLDRGVVDRFRAAGRRVFGPPRAAAQLECSKVVREGLHGAPRHSDGALSRLRVVGRDARAVIASGEFGFPVVAQGRRPRRREGRRRRGRRARKPRRAIRAAMDERAVRRRRRAPRDRGVPGRARGLVLRAVRRHAARMPIALGAGSQAHLRRRPGAQHRRHGRVRAEPAASTRRCRRRSCARSSIRCCAGCAPKAPSTAASSTAGLMLTCAGPKVIEYNVRFGDPEAQVVMPLDRRRAAAAARRRGRRRSRRRTASRCASGVSVGVVLAAAGYPGPVKSGAPIAGLDRRRAQCPASRSSTPAPRSARRTDRHRRRPRADRRRDRPRTYQAAIDRAYEAVSLISFEGMQYRRDIGAKALGA